MSKTIEEKLVYLKKIFELISPMGQAARAIEILRTTAEILELRSDFSLIEGEYGKFLESREAGKN